MIKLRKPITCKENIIFKYSSSPFKEKENAIGLMEPKMTDDGIQVVLIYVHPKLAEKKKLEVIAHEAIHASYPDLSETQVEYGGEIIGEVIWKAGYRKVAKPKL